MHKVKKKTKTGKIPKPIKIKKEKTEEDRTLHPMSHYVDDRLELVKQIFGSLKPKTITNLAPDFLKKKSLDDIEELCLNELLGISTKRLLSIINATKCPSDTESSSDSDVEHKEEHISLEEISSDSEIEGGKKKSKSANGKSRDKKSAKNPDQKGENNGQISVLELLELQARARAIRSQLALEPVTKIEVDSDAEKDDDDKTRSQKSANGTDSREPARKRRHDSNDRSKEADKASTSQARSATTAAKSSKSSKSSAADTASTSNARTTTKEAEIPAIKSTEKLKRNYRLKNSESDATTSKRDVKSKNSERARLPLIENIKLEVEKEIKKEARSKSPTPDVIPIIPEPETVLLSDSSDGENDAKQQKNSRKSDAKQHNTDAGAKGAAAKVATKISAAKERKITEREEGEIVESSKESEKEKEKQKEKEKEKEKARDKDKDKDDKLEKERKKGKESKEKEIEVENGEEKLKQKEKEILKEKEKMKEREKEKDTEKDKEKEKVKEKENVKKKEKEKTKGKDIKEKEKEKDKDKEKDIVKEKEKEKEEEKDKVKEKGKEKEKAREKVEEKEKENAREKEEQKEKTKVKSKDKGEKRVKTKDNSQAKEAQIDGKSSNSQAPKVNEKTSAPENISNVQEKSAEEANKAESNKTAEEAQNKSQTDASNNANERNTTTKSCAATAQPTQAEAANNVAPNLEDEDDRNDDVISLEGGDLEEEMIEHLGEDVKPKNELDAGPTKKSGTEHDSDVISLDSSDDDERHKEGSESWHSRYLKSSKVSKVLATSRLGKRVRDNIKKSKRSEKDAERVKMPEEKEKTSTSYASKHEDGSIDQYKELLAMRQRKK